MADLLPPNATPLERDLSEVTARIGGLDVPVDQLFDPRRCPADLLPWLAWRHRVLIWNPSWPEAVKRAVIAAAPEINATRGTPHAVETALSSLGCSFTMSEWFEQQPPGQPGTFQVDFFVNGSQALLDQDLFRDALASIQAAKNTRSHFHIRAGAEHGAGMGMAAVCVPRQWIDATATGGGRDGASAMIGLAAGTHVAPRTKATTRAV
ncbi:phage tail protein I [Telmatospirillum sp. J64-1]|uniref:phage tail protein I n=1 Tax=Telmatospirillum sp. J64-1 TaxID=2502183 RepID=UPI00115CE190|nr:phage tail protein I [Telmatospirillum sp. J64-1]